MFNIDIYVVTHKKLDCILEERTVIGVGNKSIENVCLYDNVGNNISEKNDSFCELTALYWMWKNSTSRIVGLEHYRRQFIKDNRLLNKEEVTDILSAYDVILPQRINLSSSIYHAFVKDNKEDDLIVVRRIIEKKYPDYIEAFDNLRNTNRLYVCNMFIAKREIVDDYCKWLFDILFEAEKFIDLSDRTSYQKRLYGFLSERLLNVYMWKNKKIKIKEVKICEPDLGCNATQKFVISREIKYQIKKVINYKKYYR